MQLYWKETPAEVFFFEYWEIFKNSLFYVTPLVVASGPLFFDTKFMIDWCDNLSHDVTTFCQKMSCLEQFLGRKYLEPQTRCNIYETEAKKGVDNTVHLRHDLEVYLGPC